MDIASFEVTQFIYLRAQTFTWYLRYDTYDCESPDLFYRPEHDRAYLTLVPQHLIFALKFSTPAANFFAFFFHRLMLNIYSLSSSDSSS